MLDNRPGLSVYGNALHSSGLHSWIEHPPSDERKRQGALNTGPSEEFFVYSPRNSSGEIPRCFYMAAVSSSVNKTSHSRQQFLHRTQNSSENSSLWSAAKSPSNLSSSGRFFRKTLKLIFSLSSFWPLHGRPQVILFRILSFP